MRVLAAGAAAASLLGVAACGDSKDSSPQAKAFCAVSAPIKGLAGVLDTEDTAKTKAAFEAAESALAKVAGDPPAKIAADVNTVKTTFAAANDAMKKAGYDPGKVDKAAGKSVTALEDQAFVTAGDNIAAWTKENC